MNNASEALKVSTLSKSYSEQTVLKDLSMVLKKGSVNLLLGANGSGKSTFLKILAGLSAAPKNSLSYFSDFRIPAAKIGYLSHNLMLYPDLTVIENLKLFSRVYKVRLDLVDYLISWNIGKLGSKKVTELSKGEQFRVALARSFINTPELLILDEPTSPLDNSSVQILISKIDELKNKSENFCALIATHDIARLVAIADRVLLLSDGSISSDSEDLINNDIRPEEAKRQVCEIYNLANR